MQCRLSSVLCKVKAVKFVKMDFESFGLSNRAVGLRKRSSGKLSVEIRLGLLCSPSGWEGLLRSSSVKIVIPGAPAYETCFAWLLACISLGSMILLWCSGLQMGELLVLGITLEPLQIYRMMWLDHVQL